MRMGAIDRIAKDQCGRYHTTHDFTEKSHHIYTSSLLENSLYENVDIILPNF